MNVLEVSPYFESIVDINDMEPYCKPMPESFQRAMLRAGESDPRRCVLIDDMLRNIAGARAFGMRTVLFGGDHQQSVADARLANWADLSNTLERLEASPA